MNRSSYSASSSLLAMGDVHKQAYPFSAGASQIRVEVTSLDIVAQSLDFQKQILLKIDTQGYEQEVLSGALQTLERTQLIIVETSFMELYEHQPQFPEVYSFLSRRNFEYIGSWDQFHDPRNGRPLQQDAMFLRKP